MAMGTRCERHNQLYTGIRCPDCAADDLTAPELGGGEPVRQTLRHDELAPGVAARILAAQRPPERETAVATGANAIQVGGDHYKASYQHWDFVADLGLDYYQACATKYVTRWRKKHGIEDLEKAPHYIEKRQELIRSKHVEIQPRKRDPVIVLPLILKLAKANGLDARDIEAIYFIVTEDYGMSLEKLKELIYVVTPAAVAE